jgi:hypothetical protein
MGKYTVRLSSVPGFYAQYEGDVEVYAEDQEQAVERAFRELKRGAFSDRNSSMWRVVSVSYKGRQ